MENKDFCYVDKNLELQERIKRLNQNPELRKKLHDERVSRIKEYNELCKEALEAERIEKYGEDFYTPIYTPKSNTQSK